MQPTTPKQRVEASSLDAFAALFDRCWLCGVRAHNTWPPFLETHHIARGCNKAKALHERCCMIRTCQKCHMSRLDGMDVARQLAIKRMHDEAGYDRRRVNVLRNRQPDAITEGEVCMAVCELLADQGDEMYLFPRL